MILRRHSTDKEHRPFLNHPNLAPRAVRRLVEMWLGGVVLALVAVGYGLYCLITGHAFFPGEGQDLDVYGSAAVALAIAYLAVGVFMHVHWFWGLHPRLAVFAPVLRIIAVVVFLAK
jgi:hypothetical protein